MASQPCGRPRPQRTGFENVPSEQADLSAVARSAKADVAQLAERVLGKDEVTSSILVIGSRLRSLAAPASFV